MADTIFFKLTKIAVALFVIIFIVWGIIFGAASALAALETIQADCNLPESMCNILEVFGFPPQFLNTNTIFWYAIIPMGLIAVSIYIIFSFVKQVIPMSDWVIGAFSILGALATVPLRYFHVFVGTIMVFFGSYAYLVVLLMGVIGGIGILERLWIWAKGGFSPKEEFKEIKSYAKREIERGKELSKITGEIIRQIEELENLNRIDSMELHATRDPAIKKQIEARIHEREMTISHLKRILRGE